MTPASAPVHLNTSTPMCPRVKRRGELQAERQWLAIQVYEMQERIKVLDRVLGTNEPRGGNREAHGGRVAPDLGQGQRSTAREE